jgi:Ser/Thr protein kinase RdoA (MazF antagonist)
MSEVARRRPVWTFDPGRQRDPSTGLVENDADPPCRRLLPPGVLLYTRNLMASERSDRGDAKASGQREVLTAEELAIVLSHFDIGVIDSIAEYPRGSRKSPKLLIVSEQGKFLLKRRARGKDDPFKVAFTHSLQLYLASKQFPLPHLVGTRRENNSMLQWRNAVYELFEYIPGQGYPQTLESTFDSGRILALYHKLLETFKSEWQPPTGSYHAAGAVEQGLKTIQTSLTAGASRGEDNTELMQLATFLQQSYRHAAETVEQLGLENWPRQIVHADWHPGNMLYRENHVVAVIDYDSARLLPRIIDVANGSLQFSILGGDDDVSKWPEYLDESRFKRFLRGYDEVMLLSQAECRAIPWLMIEALIAEAVFPIAATGTFGRVEGLPFLQMVQRKVAWLQKSSERLVEMAEG